MKGLVFYSSKNSKGKVDATGAFIPEAKRFAKFYGIPDEDVIGIDCTKRNRASNRRSRVITELETREDLDILGFFGHGWPDGIQFGFKRSHIEFLVRHIRAKDTLKVAIMACLTAENDVRDTNVKKLGPATDGGFADLFRDEMVRHGITHGWVDGHKTAGHATYNPNVVRFLCEDVDDPEWGAEGGFWLVEPRSTYWKEWCRSLRKTDMRYRFITMPELGIKSALEDG